MYSARPAAYTYGAKKLWYTSSMVVKNYLVALVRASTDETKGLEVEHGRHSACGLFQKVALRACHTPRVKKTDQKMDGGVGLVSKVGLGRSNYC